jgi:hypothetical protein
VTGPDTRTAQDTAVPAPSPRVARNGSVLAALAVLALALIAAAGCTSRPAARPASRRNTPRPAAAALWTLSDRGIKTQLIMAMKRPPQLVVLGGSLALRFQPAYLRRMTGLSAFNAAVPHATPQDDWCFVNLFHKRFPAAHFRFLWIVHADEFDEFSPGAALLEDPFLSRFLPGSLVESQLGRLGASANAALLAGSRQPSVIAPDGFTISDPISVAASVGSFRRRVAGDIAAALRFYRRQPPRIDPAPSHYFALTLRLMNAMGAKPTIVLAPLQPRYLAAIYRRGWHARDRLVLAYLHGLQRRARFNILDFSRLSSVGGSAGGFYDGVHLRPATTRLVVDAVLRALPHAFAAPRAG